MTDELNPPPPEQPRGRDSVFFGFLAGVGMNILALLGSLMLGPLVIFVLLGIGLVQLLYMVPMYLKWKNEWPLYATGLAICAGLTFILNAMCWNALSHL